MSGHRWASDIAGLSAVAAATVAVSWALTYSQVLNSPWIATLVAVPILTGASLFSWYLNTSGRTATAEQWMMGTIFSPLIGAMSFAVDVFTGSTAGHYDNFVQAAFHAGSPFGIVLTLIICPVGTII